MSRRAALLRGINLSPGTRIAMADLRRLFEDLGYTGVRTLLNSGNVVFDGPRGGRGDEGARIGRAVAARLGIETGVTVIEAAQVAEAIEDNPFGPAAADPTRLLVLVLPDARAKRLVKEVAKADWLPERLAPGKRVLYLWCPGGLHKSRLWTAVLKALGPLGTGRNMATLKKLRALLEAR